ncbi:hypothetical protein COOONC_18197 [Cooperia oncophora]
MALRIESKILQDVVAELTTNQECGFKISTLTGCYDCTIGAPFAAICESLVDSTVTVACRSQQFLFKCGSSGEENEIILHFNHPTVHEQCNAHCSDRPTKFLSWSTSKNQWFNDISLPNIEPLLNTITNHWKLTLAALSSILGLAALTYLVNSVISTVLRYLWKALSHCVNYMRGKQAHTENPSM